MYKRGQAALEFLMTYGWAILVVLVAIGALAYFGVLRPERLLPEKCVIGTGSGLYCDDYTASSTTGILQVRIKNILADTVTIQSANMTVSGVGWSCAGAVGPPMNITSDNMDILNFTCTGMESGDKIKGDFTVNYNVVGGLPKTTVGQLVTTAA